jgi:GMP synthase (glutamine-hydrolysing)
MAQITVVDFGGQYAHLIRRRVRDLGVNADIKTCDKVTPDDLAGRKGVILSGGPASVTAADAPAYDPRILSRAMPMLGICYGHQLMAHALGGTVVKGKKGEYGPAMVQLADVPLFDGVPSPLRTWMSHWDVVSKVPEGFRPSAITDGDGIAGMHSDIFYSVQFHPEVEHTQHGNDILGNFIYKIAGCQKDWTLDDYVDETLNSIDRAVQGRDVIMFLSGGVDSTVAATLLSRARKEGKRVGKIHAVHIDNGLMRLDSTGTRSESEEVVEYLRKLPGLEGTILEDASAYFLKKLRFATDPEVKRKIIGNAFGYVQQKVAERLNLPAETMLCQGTLYTDTIESGKGAGDKAATIKTHHNVGCKFIEDKKKAKLLVEPNSDWYKDQVRVIGRQLGLPEEYIERQPFPGPGLGIRIVDQEVTRDKCEILKKAEHIYEQEVMRAELHRQIKQYFAVLTSTRTVGVMGDERTHLPCIALRAVVTKDFMTAAPFKMPYEVLEKISTRIVNEVEGVNRVVYDITSKPPGTIEWE